MAMAIAEDGTRIKYRKILGSSSAVADAWMEQSQPEGWDHSGGNFFFEGDTIYSYGRHFPMAIRMQREDGSVWYLINGDTYGNTTSSHQAVVRGAVTGNRHPQFGLGARNEYVIIPFSALNRAGIKPRDIDPIDSEGERTWTEMRREKVMREVQRFRQQDGKWMTTANGFEYVRYDEPKQIPFTDLEWTGEWEEKPHELHLMGSTLFRAIISHDERIDMPIGHHCDNCCWRSSVEACDSERRLIGGGYDRHVHYETITDTAYFISGLDSTSRNPWDSFFLTRLDLDYWTTHYSAEPPATVSDAYRAMRPVYIDDLVREPETRDLVKRQGDWFFVPEGATKVAADLTRLDRKKLVQASKYLERPDGIGARNIGATRHLVTRLAVIDDKLYVRGTVRHDVSRFERSRGDVHKTVKLGDVWHRAIPNVQRGSWSTGGRVD